MAKNRGAGQPKDKSENKRISRGKKQGKGRANLRKKEKKMAEYGLKTGGGVGQPKEKRENKWIRRD